LLRFLPFIMLIVPLMEIAVFILVGQQIGVVPTILLVIATAILGATLLRHQGLALAMKVKGELEAGRAPARDLAHGAMMIAAGVLLLTPGFVTDTLGFLLFVPFIRDRIFAFLADRIKTAAAMQAGGPFAGAGAERWHENGRPASTREGKVIDLDGDQYSNLDDGAGLAANRGRESPWAKPDGTQANGQQSDKNTSDRNKDGSGI
jgi:UPF0716 protein FxsA